jgi:hypothetical protein
LEDALEAGDCRAQRRHGRGSIAGCVVACAISVTACSGGAPETPHDEGSGSVPDYCVPGAQVACDCSDGTHGVTTCNATGKALRACICGNAPADSTPTVYTATGGVAGQTALTHPLAGGSMQATALAHDVRISQLAIYQAVKIPLMDGGQEVTARNAPVVVGKQALVRVYAEPLAGFAPRALIAQLTLSSSSEVVQSIAVRADVDAASSEPALGSTLDLELPAAYVTADLRYSVALYEADAKAASTGTVDPGVRWPADKDALAILGAREAGAVHVLFVPYRYLADGSGRLPQVDDNELANYRSHVHALYPASDIVIDVHDPVDYKGTITPETGWSDWLDFHCALRASEHPDPKLIYFGSIAPADSWQDYGGGIVGISNVPGPAGNYGRCSVGIGFPDAAETVAHELGHSLGLPHAPCGVSGGPYPYPDAQIGSWGYGLVSQTLKDPQQYYDMMSYCEPAFISDFNYERLFERIRYLNEEYDRVGDTTANYMRVMRGADGSLALRGSVEVSGEPGGAEDKQSVMLEDAQGVLSPSDAYFFPFSTAGTGEWLIPDTGAAAVHTADGAAVRLR